MTTADHAIAGQPESHSLAYPVAPTPSTCRPVAGNARRTGRRERGDHRRTRRGATPPAPSAHARGAGQYPRRLGRRSLATARGGGRGITDTTDPASTRGHPSPTGLVHHASRVGTNTPRLAPVIVDCLL